MLDKKINCKKIFYLVIQNMFVYLYSQTTTNAPVAQLDRATDF